MFAYPSLGIVTAPITLGVDKMCDGTDRTGFLAPLEMTAFTKAFQRPVREVSAEIER
jgi:hypothetical protein